MDKEISAEPPLSPIRMLQSTAELGTRYPAWIVDIWGVMHDGITARPQAVAAAVAFRARGGLVLLLSNSPRPSPQVQDQLRELGVVDQAYDATLTSGDLTRHELQQRPGSKVFHLGPERDKPIFEGLDIDLVGPEEAELVLCSGLFNDENETPLDYNELLESLATRDVPMLCANPDHMVERGNELIYCAGALADLYEDFGGEVTYSGKPYETIYELAFEVLNGLAGRKLERNEILAIGDGINTDMAGAANMGLDALFVASGLHAEDLRTIASRDGGDGETLDSDTLTTLFAGKWLPRAAINELA